jgi:beta-xylosidase
MVEDNYAISEENSVEQGTVNKINVLPNQSNLTPINNGGRYNICSQIEETVESLIRLWLNHDRDQ